MVLNNKPKKHGKETKDAQGRRVIPAALRKALKAERKRLGVTDNWEPEMVSLG